jgi:hypothetical protein
MPAESGVGNVDTAAHGRYALIFPLLAGLAGGFGSYAGVGHSLWLFFAPLLIGTFLIPYFVLAESGSCRRLAACGLVAIGIAIAWRIVTNLSFTDWLRCVCVTTAYVAALGGLAVAFERAGIGSTFAAGLTAVLGFAWLSWPIWLCPWLDGPHAQTIVNALAIAHPLLALNRVVFDLYREWDRYPLMYQITILNQDVLYEIPATIGYSCAAHVALGTLGFFAAAFRIKPDHMKSEKQNVG